MCKFDIPFPNSRPSMKMWESWTEPGHFASTLVAINWWSQVICKGISGQFYNESTISEVPVKVFKGNPLCLLIVTKYFNKVCAMQYMHMWMCMCHNESHDKTEYQIAYLYSDAVKALSIQEIALMF